MKTLLGLLVFICSLNSFAINVFGKDPRTKYRIDMKSKILPLVKIIYRETKIDDGSIKIIQNICTGSLVDDYIVLTARHCLPTDNSIPIEVYTGYEKGAYFEKSSVIKTMAPDVSSKSRADDWALLLLEKNFSKYGKFEINDATYLRDIIRLPFNYKLEDYVLMAGYSHDVDRGEVLTVDQRCQMYSSPYDRVVYHSCSSTGGSSGSPLLLCTEDSCKIAALHVSALRLKDKSGKIIEQDAYEEYKEDVANMAILFQKDRRFTDALDTFRAQQYR